MSASTLRLSEVDDDAAAAWVDGVLRDQPADARADYRSSARLLVENHGLLLSIDRVSTTIVTLVAVPGADPLPDGADQATAQDLTAQGYDVWSNETTTVSGYSAARLTAVAAPGADPSDVGFVTEVLVSGSRSGFVLAVTSTSPDDPTAEAIVGSLRVA